jgi:hypothetical protein
MHKMPVASASQKKALRVYYLKNAEHLKNVSHQYYLTNKDEMLRKKKQKYHEYRARLVQTISEIPLPVDQQPQPITI